MTTKLLTAASRIAKRCKHLFEYIIFLSLSRSIRLISIDRAADLCSSLAKKLGPLLPVTKIAKKNLRSALGDEIDDKKIIDDLWDNFGRFIGEFPHLGSMSPEEITNRVEIEGLEHIEIFRRESRPFFLFTGHFANLGFCAFGCY